MANADGLGAVCVALDRAWSALMLYEPGHAARTRALEEGAAKRCAFGVARVALRVGPEGWLDEAGVVRGGVGGELARLLHRLDVVAIELGSSLDATRLERLLGVLARARVEAWRGAALEGEVRAGVGEAAAVVPVRTSMLTLVEGAAEGAKAGAGAVSDGVTWAGLADALLGAGANGESGADALEERLESMIAGATCQASVAREVNGLGHRLADLPEAERERASARIAKWMSGLPSSTRAALLAMNGPDSAGAGKLLHALAGKLPIEQIISALEGSGAGGGNLNARHNLMLFSKLSSLAMDQSVDLQRRVLRAMEQIGASRGVVGVVGGGGGETLRAVEQLLQPNRADDFTPKEYRERLSDLSQGMLRTASRLKDPEELSLDSLRVRVGEIGAYLTRDGTAPSAGVMAHLGRAILPTLSKGSMEALLAAARAVGRCGASEAGTVEATAGRALREAVLAPETIHAALELAGKLEPARTPLLEMIGTLGVVGIDRVVEYVAARPSGAEPGIARGSRSSSGGLATLRGRGRSRTWLA